MRIKIAFHANYINYHPLGKLIFAFEFHSAVVHSKHLSNALAHPNAIKYEYCLCKREIVRKWSTEWLLLGYHKSDLIFSINWKHNEKKDEERIATNREKNEPETKFTSKQLPPRILRANAWINESFAFYSHSMLLSLLIFYVWYELIYLLFFQ